MALLKPKKTKQKTGPKPAPTGERKVLVFGRIAPASYDYLASLGKENMARAIDEAVRIAKEAAVVDEAIK